MDASQVLKEARTGVGLSQRALAERAQVAQSAIARIESGRVVPGFDTLEHLLHACGRTLQGVGRYGEGIDRTVIRRLLRLSPRERLDLAVEEAANLKDVLAMATR